MTPKSKGTPLIEGGLDAPELLEKVPFAIYVCDSDGRLVYCNSRAVKLWGCTPVIGDDSVRRWGSYKLCFNDLQVPREEAPMASVPCRMTPVTAWALSTASTRRPRLW